MVSVSASTTFAKSIKGSRANDLIAGQKKSNDFLRGFGGNDRIDGLSGNDKILGGSGGDNIFGGMGNDTLRGGSGVDMLAGYKGRDRIYGDNGNDGISGWSGDDSLYGGAGNDRIVAGSGNDTVYGGAGDDSIWGVNNGDVHGNNDLSGDTLDGGKGNDSIKSADGERDLIICGEGTDKVIADELDTVTEDCEEVHRVKSTKYKELDLKAGKYQSHLNRACRINRSGLKLAQRS